MFAWARGPVTGLVASAAAGSASLGVGVADHESVAVVGVLNVLDDAGLEGLLGLFVEVEGESLDGELVVALVLLLLEGHPELGSGAGHAREVDLDAVTGGFNLQIAWSTGHLAGLCAAME